MYVYGIVNVLVMFFLIYYCLNVCFKIFWLDKMIYVFYYFFNFLVIEFIKLSVFFKLVFLICCFLYIYNMVFFFDNFYEMVKIGV